MLVIEPKDEVMNSKNHRCRSSVFIALIVLVMASAIPCCGASRTGKKYVASRENQFLYESLVKLDNHLFGPNDLKKCEMLFGKAKGSRRLAFMAILARNERLMEEDSIGALELLSPDLIGRDKATEWKKKQEEAKKEALAERKSSLQQARMKPGTELPEKPTGLFVEFPSPDMWKINAENAECAIETARALMDLHQYQQALTAIKRIGKEVVYLMEALAAEGGGDLLTEIGQYEKSVEFYDYGLRVIQNMFHEEYSDKYESAKSEYIKSRIEKSREKAKRLWDIEKYGKGFVLYRDAEYKRRCVDSPLEALLIYQDIQNQFPKTVYSEASVAYSVKCLLALSDVKHQRGAWDILKREEESLAKMRKQVAAAKRERLPGPALRKLEEQLKDQETRAQRMRSVLGSGKGVVKMAEDLAGSFVSENKFGLYRGEVLVDMANYAFEKQLQPERAFDLFTQAWEWMSVAEKADAQLDAFAVPDKAREVSKAPEEEKSVDFWGNSKKNEPPIGAILNRRTCKWYLADLREQCALGLGFLHFYRGENEEAIAWYEKLPALDKDTGRLEKEDEWNNYRRMKWGVEHGYLFAYPEELKLYKGQQRFAILLGDFYYCTERFSKAAEIAERLLDGEFGKLEGKLRAFPQLVLGSAIYWTEGSKPAFLVLEKALKRRYGTFTEDRIVFALGNIPPLDLDVEMIERGCAYMKELAYSNRSNEYVYRARLSYGWRLLETPDEAEGIRVLQSIPKSATDWKELADFYLHELEEKRQTSEQSGK